MASQKVKLFGITLSPFVEKVRIAMVIKNIDHEMIKPKNIRDPKLWNPQTQKMPVVEIDGERVFDSTHILDRLDELFPDTALQSEDPKTRALQRLLEDWSDEGLFWYIVSLRWSKNNAQATALQISDKIPMPAPLRPLVRFFATRYYTAQVHAQGIARLPNEVIVSELGERLDDLCALIGDGPFLTDKLSRADLSVYGMLNSGMSGSTPDIEQLIKARAPLRRLIDKVREAANEKGSSITKSPSRRSKRHL